MIGQRTKLARNMCTRNMQSTERFSGENYRTAVLQIVEKKDGITLITRSKQSIIFMHVSALIWEDEHEQIKVNVHPDD